VDYKVVDNICFVGVVFKHDSIALLNQGGPFFVQKRFHFTGLIVPVILILSVSIDISLLLCSLNNLIH
jgi:hypothetical protein